MCENLWTTVSEQSSTLNPIVDWRWKGNWHLSPLWAAILRASSSRMSLARILLARFSLLASKCETRLAPQDEHNWHSDCVPTPHLRHGFGSELGRRLNCARCCLHFSKMQLFLHCFGLLTMSHWHVFFFFIVASWGCSIPTAMSV